MTATGRPSTGAERRLSAVIRVVAGVFVVFFLLALIGSATQSSMPELLYRLVGWGSIGDAEEQMIAIVYIVWGLFLWRAASDPLRSRLFIEFTIVANAAHALLMGIQSFAYPGEHLHLAGDVPALLILVALLTIVWVPVRREAAAAA
jgi:hypothetical protein